MSRLARVVFLVLGSAALALPGFSQVYQTPETDQKPAKHAAADRASGEGMLVAIDPVTGELRQPTAAEAAALTGPKKDVAPSRPLRIVRTAAGMEMIELDESFMEYLTVRLGHDGALHSACVHREQLDTILRLPVQTQKLEEK